MKKVYYLYIALLLTASCSKKSSVEPTTGKIILAPTRTIGTGFQTVKDCTFTAQDSTTILALMQQNNLATNGLVFYSFGTYNEVDQQSRPVLIQIGNAMQVRNNLPVFFQDLAFAFKNGALNQDYPSNIVGAISLNNKASLSLQILRNKYIQQYNAAAGQNSSIQDSTLVAQLGYYDLNMNAVPAGTAPNYIKAWYVHPQYSLLTLGYFRDDNGATLSFKPAASNVVVF